MTFKKIYQKGIVLLILYGILPKIWTYVSFSYRRLNHGVRDYHTLLTLIELRSKQYHQELLNSRVFPYWLRASEVKVSHRNLLELDPDIWHCSWCRDTNPPNPYRVFNVDYELYGEYFEVFRAFRGDSDKNMCAIEDSMNIEESQVILNLERFGSVSADLLEPDSEPFPAQETPDIFEEENMESAEFIIGNDHNSNKDNSISEYMGRQIKNISVFFSAQLKELEEELSDHQKSHSNGMIVKDDESLCDSAITGGNIQLNQNIGQTEEDAAARVEQNEMLSSLPMDSSEVNPAAQIWPFDMYNQHVVYVAWIACGTLVLLALNAILTYVYRKITQELRFAVESYPKRLVDWLEEKSNNLFSEKKFHQLINLLRWYLPIVRFLLGDDHVDSSAFSHYLARAYSATGRPDRALPLLLQVLDSYAPFGKDIYLAQVFEDLGVAQHQLHSNDSAIKSLHSALRIYSEESVCHACVGSGRRLFQENDWDSDNNLSDDEHPTASIDSHIFSTSPKRSRLSGIRTSLAVSSSDTSQPSDSESEDLPENSSPDLLGLHHETPILANLDMNDTNTPNSSPSTMDLNQAFFAQSDLALALRELEDLLTDLDSPVISVDDSNTTNTTLFRDFQTVPTVDVARVCKELADVYAEVGNFGEALLFYNNSLEVLLKLEQPELESIVEEIKTLKESLLERIKEEKNLFHAEDSKEKTRDSDNASKAIGKDAYDKKFAYNKYRVQV